MKKDEWIKIIEDLENLKDEEKFHLLQAVEKDSLTNEQESLIIQKSKEQDEIDRKEINRLDAELGILRTEEARYEKIEREMIEKLADAEEQASDRAFEKMKADLDIDFKKDEEAIEKELKEEEKEIEKLEAQVKAAEEKGEMEEIRGKLK